MGAAPPLAGGPGLPPPPTPAYDQDAGGDIAKITDANRERSYVSRQERRDLNRRNWRFVNGQQDWSHKLEGQTRLFLPDLPLSVQQLAAGIENQLINFSNWFSIETLGGLSIFDGDTLRLLVQHVLDRLWKPGNEVETALKFPTWLADAVVLGIVESEFTAKVYGVDSERCVYMLESSDPEKPAGITEADTGEDDLEPAPERTYERLSQTIRKAYIRTFRAGLDLVPYEDSYPDPSALNLFHIHEVTRHVSELRSNPDYDPDVIEMVARRCTSMMEDRDKAVRSGQESSRLTNDPNEVRVREYWGDVIDPQTGKYKERNVFLTTVNGKILRPPTPNPFWHGFRPLVRVPLGFRRPLSPVSVAILDMAVPQAEAENEVASLMVDGGIASVWGVRQIRRDLLEDPTSVSKGIGAQATLILKKNAPLGAKVLERVDEGTNTPQYGMDMLNRLGRARQTATMTNDLKVGNLPPRQTLATELVMSEDGSDNLTENMSVRIEENGIEPILQLLWLTMWQQMDDFSAPELVQILGSQRAYILQALSPEERFYLMSNNVKFKVRGLRNLISQVKDFQKASTLMTSVAGSPVMATAFVQKYDMTRMLEKMIRWLNVDPTEIEYRPGEGASAGMMQAANPTAAGPGTPPGEQVPPGGGQVEQGFAPQNPTGFRGTQV